MIIFPQDNMSDWLELPEVSFSFVGCGWRAEVTGWG